MGPLVVDSVSAVVLAGLALAVLIGDVGGGWEQSRDVQLVTLAFGCVAVALRRRWPRVSLLVVTAGTAWHVSVTGAWDPLLVTILGVATYSMAVRIDRRTTWLTVSWCAAGLYGAYAWGVDHHPRSTGSLPVLAFFGMVTAVGEATRNRRAYLEAADERARRAEQTREEEANRRVIEERLRIARELHDVVAHHIAVINMQAGGARRALERRPEQAQAALVEVGRACDTALKELASIVGVLRRSGDPDDEGAEPAAGLSRLPELLGEVAASDLHVAYRRVGDARELPTLVDLSAYRIVQEALTNARRYGTGMVELTVVYAEDGLRIEVINPIAGGRRRFHGSGYGIVGMRERAAAARGVLSAGVGSDGRFAVRAELPAPAEERS